MKTIRAWMLFMVGIWILAGCGQEPTVLPTLAPTALPNEPPTATAAPTDAPTAAPRTRPTFPPTWTPSPDPLQQPPTDTPQPTVAANQPVGKPTLEVCGPFRDDRNRYNPEFTLGTDVTVAWTPVQGAVNYRIRLTDENDTELKVDLTTETSYTFSGDLFESGMFYSWSVYPLDVLGQQMCFDAGGDLFPK